MDRQASTTESDLEGMLFDESMEAKALPFSLLDRITNGFSDNQQIGCGGFAVVYKGLLENEAVAVKKLLSQRSDFDERKFSGEVRCLMKAKHKNIVRFLGYCSDTQGQWVESVMADVRERLLCFEYLPNGGLDKYIKDAYREWGKCYQIIKGVCEGLHYLHEKQIVHSDLKPANILLDSDMVPKITDFGISRCFDGEQTHVITENIIGSMGYLAPESLNGKISFKSDIYSLGVIIIEILTAEKGCPVVEDVLECWRHKVEKSQKEEQLEQIKVCTEVGKSCLEYDPAKRPSAQGIIDILKQTESRVRQQFSTSIVPQASSLVQYKNKTSSSSAVPLVENKSSFMIEVWRHRDSVTVATALKDVAQAIGLFYAQDSEKVSMKQLYSHSYNLALHNKGEELYSVTETAMASGVQSLCRQLDAAPADGALFLQMLLAKWNQHVRAVKMTRDILMYVESNFVVTNRKTPIYKLGLRLWRHHLMTSSEKIRERLIEAVKQRGGEGELVASVNKMLAELGADVPRLFFPDGELHVAGP